MGVRAVVRCRERKGGSAVQSIRNLVRYRERKGGSAV